MTATITDFTVPAPGLPIQIQRTYDSLVRSTSSDFGFGWKLGIQVDLVTNPNGDVTFTMNGQREDVLLHAARQWVFSYWFLPAYTAEPGFYGSLTTTGDNCSGVLLSMGSTFECAIDNAGLPYQATGYVYTDPYGRVYTIGADGSLQSVQDLSGNTITVTPSGITSSNGLNVPFVRDSQGRITQITDTLGNVYVYAYEDGNGNLTSVQYPGIPTAGKYAYDDTHLLTAEFDKNGNLAGSTVYDTSGRVSSITDAVGNTTQYAYDTTGLTTTVTNPDGGTVVTVADAYGMPLSVTESVTGAQQRTTRYTYDANHNKLTMTDALMQTTKYMYDTNGFQTTITDPLNNVSTRVYNQVGGPTTITDPQNIARNITNVVYDTNFRVSTITDVVGAVAQFPLYNAAGQPLTYVDARGNSSHYTYDQFGNLQTSTDALSRVTTSVYDTIGNLKTRTDPLNNTTTYFYDAYNRQTSVVDATNHATKYTYDGNNNKLTETDRNGNKTTYTYDNANRVSQVLYADGTTRSFPSYDFRGNKLTEIDQLQRMTTNSYDLVGRLVSKTVASGTTDAATTAYTYDGDDRKLTETDPRGNTTYYAYDAAGRMTSVKDGAGNLTQYGYDSKGQRTSMLDAKQRTTTYTFDPRGRQLTTNTPDGKTVTKTYDGLSKVLSVQDEESNTTYYTYDAASQLTQVVDALNQKTSYGYDMDGNKTSQTDANGNTTSYVYDTLNRRTSRTLPLLQTESWTYDFEQNQVTHVDFNGKITTLAYDSLNRLLSKTPDATFSASTVSFMYTATGQRQSMTDASGVTTYTYSNRDQVLQKATPEGALSYTYDLAGNVASLLSSNMNGTNVSYAWDADNRLSIVTDNVTNGVTNYSYDATSQIASFTYPNGATHASTYDLRDRTTALNVTGPGLSAIASYAQTFGPSGHKLSVAESGGRAEGYGYDLIYRLLNETISGDPVTANNGVLTYMLDPVGNRKSLASTLATLPAQTLTYDNDDRLTTDTYDANGNTVSSGGTNYTYDFEDRLLSTSSGVQIAYDGDGNRVSETVGGVTTKYLVDDLTPTRYAQVAEETANGAVVAQFTYGLMRISQNRVGVLSYYGYDAGGSTRELLSTAGAVTDTYEYDAFGNTVAQTGSTVNEFLYRGEQFDPALGMYYL